MTTPHAATNYTNPAQSSPAETEAAQLAEVEASAGLYEREQESTVNQYRTLTGVAAPTLSTGDYPAAGTITEVKDWVAGQDSDDWDEQTPSQIQLARAQYAYDTEIVGSNRVTLVDWLLSIPGVNAE